MPYGRSCRRSNLQGFTDRAFEKAAFYGGTALRIFHGLDPLSEEL